MSESKVHRLRLQKRVGHSTLSGTTGRHFVNFTNADGDIPAGYRVVRATWRVEEDSTSNVSETYGNAIIYSDSNGVDRVTFLYNVDALPASIVFEVVVERSDEPDVFVDLGAFVGE